jgi:oligosaccharide repeat unit polymerase
MRWTGKSLFLVPSFYGLTTWSLAYALCLMRLVGWRELSIETHILAIAVLGLFGVSTVLFAPLYERYRLNVQSNRPRNIGRNHASIIVLHVLGYLGLVLYLSDVARIVGGWRELALALALESHVVRLASYTSVGIQLTYFGWLAIGITAYRYRAVPIPRSLLFMALIQFAGNLTFVDRTRPVWIIATAALVFLASRPNWSFRTVLRRAAVLGIFFLVVFFLIAEWTGKLGEGVEGYGYVRIGGLPRILYMYVTSGLPYLTALIEQVKDWTYEPTRTLYPLVRALAVLGVFQDPPSQVLFTLEVPFPTNVGTFIEPLFSDGGYFFVIAGIFIHSLGFDALGLHLLRRNNPLAAYAWANLCFASSLAFFVPKFTSFPFWLFILLGLLPFHGVRLAPSSTPVSPSNS